jgi:hypothetical protein
MRPSENPPDPLERPWLAFPPSGLRTALRVFGSRAARGKSTNPSRVLSWAYTPPRRFAPKLVPRPGPPGFFRYSRRISSLRSGALQRGRTREPLSAPGVCRASEGRCLALRRPHPQGLATLSAGSVLPSSEASFSLPRSWASLFRALLRPRGSPAVSRVDPLLRFNAKPTGLTAALQRLPLPDPAAPPAPGRLLATEWSRCSPELPHLSGLLPPDTGESTFLSPTPPVLPSPAS